MSDVLITKLKKPGARHGKFRLDKMKRLPEIDCVLKELTHEPSGASIMHLECDDPENVFCLSLKTHPHTSNGVAHILEHTVLCGSDKYPVKDPFFSMTRRSLNTFMNAMTGADFTCYPAASQVPKDFYNLLEVYLDAVFRPKLHRLSFTQEGHRLEFRQLDDPSSPLDRQGIVYNEMKGALSSAEARLSEAMGAALFPDTIYGINSGGDPLYIPSLTHEELLQFHRQYYHPSRCLFYFYGNIKTEDHLNFLEKELFKEVSPQPPLSPLPSQPRFLKPATVQLGYPSPANEDPTGKTLVGMGWLTTSILNQKEVMALSVLDTILMGTDASPLKQALLTSGLCHQADSSLDAEIHEVPYMLVMKGCEKDNARPLEALVRHTLQQVIKEGISPQQIDTALHQIELERSEITGDHYPHGLNLFMRAGLLKQHGGEAEDALKIHSLFDELRQLFQDPGYLPGMIQKYILQNPHMALVTCAPDPQLGDKEAQQERETLETLRSKMNENQAREIVKDAEALRQFQKAQDDVDHSCLPMIGLDEVPPEPKDYPLVEEQKGALRVFHHRCFTNKILDFELVFPLSAVDQDELHLLQLFAYLWPRMGAGDRGYAETLSFAQEHTGGFHASLSLNVQARNPQKFTPILSLGGKALSRKAKPFCQLMADYASRPNFSDKQRVRELVSKLSTYLHQSVTSGSLKYAMTTSASQLSLPSWIHHQWSGLPYYYQIREYAQHLEKSAGELVERMEAFAQRLLCPENSHLVISCDGHAYDALVEERFHGLIDLRLHPKPAWEAAWQPEPVTDQGRLIGASVAFTARTLSTVPYTYPAAAALTLASNLMDNLILHPRIREEGGAYGGGSSCNTLSGNFAFYAYRDPNVYSTVRAFEDAMDAICQGRFEAEDLEEAKLEAIQKLDSPVPPGSRAMTAYYWLQTGLTLSTRQAFRRRLLHCTAREVMDAVRDHLFPNFDPSALVTFGGKSLLEKENKKWEAAGGKPLPLLSL